MVESSNPAIAKKGGEATAAISVRMVESSNSAGEDLQKGAGAAEPKPNGVVSVWSYLSPIIIWSLVLWANIEHIRAFGPWSELAFFLVFTMPLLVFSYIAGRQSYLAEQEQEQAAQAKKEQPMMPTRVPRWEDMAMEL